MRLFSSKFTGVLASATIAAFLTLSIVPAANADVAVAPDTTTQVVVKTDDGPATDSSHVAAPAAPVTQEIKAPIVVATKAPKEEAPVVTPVKTTVPTDKTTQPAVVAKVSAETLSAPPVKSKLKFNLAAWLMPGGSSHPWVPNQTIADNVLTDVASLSLFDKSTMLVCGSTYQIDLYYNSKTTDVLIKGGVLYGPNNPQEDLATGALGKNVNPYKVITTPACPAPKPIVALTGDATCTAAGTWSVTWTVTITNYAGLSEVDLKVIKHLPAGSLINGVDAQVWLNEWNEHSANHHLSPFPVNGVVTYTQTNIPGNATSATSGVQYDFKGGPSGDPEKTVELSGSCTPPPPTASVCTAHGSYLVTNLNQQGFNYTPTGTPYADTRANGHYEYVPHALRMYTDDNTGLAKVQAARAVSIPVANYGGSFSLDQTLTTGTIKVGINVRFIDGAQTFTATAEPGTPGYNQLWSNASGWLPYTAKSQNDNNGQGGPYSGSLDDIVASHPHAIVYVEALTDGSGVYNDALINSWSTPCNTYTYDNVPPVVGTFVAATATDTCGIANDTLTIPAKTDEVSYSKTDNRVNGVGSVVVNATAVAPYVFAEGAVTSWTFQFTNEPCPIVITTFVAATATDTCGIANDTLTIPAKTDEVSYSKTDNRVNGVGSVVVNATAVAPYVFAEGAVTSWTFQFTNEPCPETTVTVDKQTAPPVSLAFTGSELPVGGFIAAVLFLLFGAGALFVVHRRKTGLQKQ